MADQSKRRAVLRASPRKAEAMTNEESARSAIVYTSAEVDELSTWSRQGGWAPTPATVHRLLATANAAHVEADRLRLILRRVESQNGLPTGWLEQETAR
jgi:hypothetical protein